MVKKDNNKNEKTIWIQHKVYMFYIAYMDSF